MKTLIAQLWQRWFTPRQPPTVVLPQPKPSLHELVEQGKIQRDTADKIRAVIGIVEGLGFNQLFWMSDNDPLSVYVGGFGPCNLRHNGGQNNLWEASRNLLARRVIFLIESPPADDHPLYRSRNGQIDPYDLEPMVSIMRALG